MPTHRTKRPFAGAASDPAQRHITSFFVRDDEATAVRAATHSNHDDGSRSAVSAVSLPPSVQADLLAVGMRVRKSVPEGYKTGKELWPAARHGPGHGSGHGHGHGPGHGPGHAGGLSAAAQRELLPFCGIHRVGGLGVQSLSTADEGDELSGHRNVDPVEPVEPPSLTSSQETVSSDDGMDLCPPPATRKRLYGSPSDDDDDDDDDVNEDHPAAWSTTGSIPQNRRLLAVPRRRLPQTQTLLCFSKAGRADVRIVGQENVNGADDFDEAPFLDASTWAGQPDMDLDGV